MSSTWACTERRSSSCAFTVKPPVIVTLPGSTVITSWPSASGVCERTASAGRPSSTVSGARGAYPAKAPVGHSIVRLKLESSRTVGASAGTVPHAMSSFHPLGCVSTARKELAIRVRVATPRPSNTNVCRSGKSSSASTSDQRSPVRVKVTPTRDAVRS